jgi:hypothetical protein
MLPWDHAQLSARCALAAAVCLLDARKFYDDDPLVREPRPLDVDQVRARKISDVYDLFSHVLATPGEEQTPKLKVRAGDINTVGDVMDGAWYEKRHARARMTPEEIAVGPGASDPPAAGAWTILSAKSEGITPGFLIRDENGRLYFLKFDPMGNRELATAADVISSKLFYALGYHVPENYIVYFDRSRLVLQPGTTFRDTHGRRRDLTTRDVGEILTKVPRDADGLLRATASRVVPGKPLGPYRYYGTRRDDPNDTIPHEHRRSLRGLHVFCAWLAHDDSRAINSLDTLVEESGLSYVRHYLIDFGSTLGSASTKINSPRSGFEQFFTWRSAALEFFTLGLYVPKWATIDYPDLPSVGRFSAEHFNPVAWTPEYPNPAFENRLPEDVFWAAEQVMVFSNEDIRAAVRTGKYTDPVAEQYVSDVLIKRRDIIGRAYLSNPLMLSRIRVEGSRVGFDDLAVKYGYLSEPPAYRYAWFEFDNEKEVKTPASGANTAEVPRLRSRYVGVDITAAGRNNKRVTVYLRQSANGYTVAGIERVL